MGKQVEQNLDLEERDDSIFATMKINARPYKASWNDNLYDRTKYAIAGLLYMLRRERSIRNVLRGAAIMFPLAFWLQIGQVKIVLMFLCLALLWTVETMNAAIEAVVDLVSPEYHEMAKVAKDVAASATFIASVTSISTGLVFIIPPLLDKLQTF